MSHYTARVVIEEVEPATDGHDHSRHIAVPAKERKVSELMSAVVKDADLSKLVEKLNAVIKGGL